MNFEVARTQMLGQQIRAWEVLDERVLRVLRETPREQFVPADYRDLAFVDAEILLGHGQVMLAPKIEGRLLQAVQAEPIDDVLVVGTGSGFLTACLARLAKQEISADFSEGDPERFPIWQENSPSPEAALIGQHDDDTIRRLVAALPQAFREAIVLREVNNLSYQEIAKIAGVPVGTVMSRLARARSMLRSAWNVAEGAIPGVRG